MILPFIAFFLALILKIIGIHLDWIIWLVIIGGILLAAGTGPSWGFWKH